MSKVMRFPNFSSYQVRVVSWRNPPDFQKKMLRSLKENIKCCFNNNIHNWSKLENILADKVPPWQRMTTGCQNIDSVLGSGIPFNGITEIFGTSGVGKTQMLLQLAIMVQLPAVYGGKERGVIYICTEDVFPSKRFHQLAQCFQRKYNLPHSDFESNTYIDHMADYEQLRRCLSVRLPNLLRVKNIGLVIIDSIAGPFRSENSNVNYTFRGQDIVDVAARLHNLSDEFKIAVVCANQVSHDLITSKIEPCLGLAWSNNVTCRMRISRQNDCPYREFEVIFAPDLPNNKCSFRITEDGICDL